MARKKVKVAYIVNNYARKVAYNKRAQNVIKKTEELSVLCGTDACAIIYGKDEQVPLMWPSSEEELSRIISEFGKRSELELDPPERRFNNQTFLNESLSKAKERLLKLQQMNREKEIWNIVSDILNGKLSLEHVKPNDLGDLLWVIEDRILTTQYRIRITKEGGDDTSHPNS